MTDTKQEQTTVFTARLNALSQITIPVELREIHDIRSGDYVTLIIQDIHKKERNGRGGGEP